MIELTAEDGHQFSAYRVDPSDTPKGAVVVLQEAFGVDPHICKVADSFAAKGYVTIVPSLIERAKKNAANPESAAADLAKQLTDLGDDTSYIDLQAAIDSVKEAGKVALVGYSDGADLAYLSGIKVKGLACAVGYYGPKIPERFLMKSKIPTLIHFGDDDPQIPAEEIIQFRANRPDVSVFTYPAVGHGFSSDENQGYNAEAAEKALERTLFWISQFVEGQPPVQMKNGGSYAQAKPDKKKKKKTSSDDMGPPMD